MPSTFGDHPIWIDATGIVRWGPQPCTGIQRVELGLIEYALAHPERLGICAMDGATGRYLAVDERTRDYLRFISEVNRSDGDLRRADRLAFLTTQLMFADNETARRLAGTLLGTNKRKGVVYELVKSAVRLVLWSYSGLRIAGRVFAWPFQRIAAGRERKQAPVILVSHEVNRHIFIERALASVGAREVNIIHDLIPVRMPELTSSRFTRRMKILLSRILRKGNLILTVSQATRDDLAAWSRKELGITDTSRIIACRLNNSIASDPTKDTPIPALEGQRFALFCSTIDIRKGQWLLVAVWKRLATMMPLEDVPHLVIVGRKGSGWPDLQRELEDAGLVRGRIHVLHGVADTNLNWAYRHAAFCLFPSRAEGWGLGVSESLAHGTPVLHSDIPILHEAAQGLMPSAPAWDVEAWTQLVHEVLITPGRLDELAERVRREHKPGRPDDFARMVIAAVEADQATRTSASVTAPAPVRPALRP